MVCKSLKTNTLVYEKPNIRRHAVIMTMAPQGSKMGHGLFPFATRALGSERKARSTDATSQNEAYRRV